MSGYPGAKRMLVAEERVFIGAMKNPVNHYAIVIHKTASNGQTSAEAQARYFQTNSEWKSVHYVVDKSGEIVQCVEEEDGAGGNCCLTAGYDHFWDQAPTKGNLNMCTFSIEHCDYSNDNSDDLTEAQKLSSFKLVAYLCKKYGITPNRIKGHNTIDPINRSRCPGNYDWNGLFRYLKGEGMGVPNGWTDTGTELHAPGTDKIVVLGNRGFILRQESWDPEDVPITNEMHRDSLSEADISMGSGQIQIFKKNAIVYTNKDGSRIYPLGEEYWYVLKDRDNCRAIIKQLQTQVATLSQGMPKVEIGTVISDLEMLLSKMKALQ